MESRAADDQPEDEVAFWRGFITWWARVKTELVPSRAWQALELAQYRAAQRREQHDEREDWVK